MIHKINIHDSRQGVLTYRRNADHTMNATIILPESMQLKVGDAIAHPQWFTQVEDKCKLLVVTEIKEERPSGGNWTQTPPPIWRRLVFETQLFSKEQVKDVLAVRIVEDEQTKKQVEKIFFS